MMFPIVDFVLGMRSLLFLFLIAIASAAPIEDEPLLKNGIEKLIRLTIEYFRWLLQRHDPYTPPELPEEHIQYDDIDLTAKVSNVKVSGETGFSVDNIYFNLPLLKSKFAATEPAVHIEGNYQISGVAFSKKLSGSGAFSFDLSGVAPEGEIQFIIVDHNLQIKDINLTYEIAGVKGTAEGLEIEGMTSEEVKDFLSNGLLKFSADHRALLCQMIGAKIKELANQFLIGKKLDYMKKLIASTPDPPPFPFLGNM